MHPKEKIVNDILKQLNPDGDALLKLILSQITDEILVNIAKADYGYKAEENILALRSFKLTGLIPTNKELDYEVLGLYRHTEPSKYQELKIGEQHLGRALSCITLLIAESFSYEDYYDCAMENSSYNLIQLVESVNYLGKNFQLTLISFLAWRFSSDSLQNFFYEGDVNNPIPIFTLIYLLLKTSYDIEESELNVLVECLIEGAEEKEKYFKENPDFYEGSNREFLGLFDPKYENVERYSKWIQLAKEIPSLTAQLKDKELIDELNKISALIIKNEHLYKKD